MRNDELDMIDNREIIELANIIAERPCDSEDCAPCIRMGRRCNDYLKAERAIKAGYRKQSENVIEFPCKPGQTLWFPSEYHDSPFPIYITHLEIYEEETIIYSDGGSEWQIEDIGKTIFLTKEEAEQALAKKRGGE